PCPLCWAPCGSCSSGNCAPHKVLLSKGAGIRVCNARVDKVVNRLMTLTGTLTETLNETLNETLTRSLTGPFTGAFTESSLGVHSEFTRSSLGVHWCAAMWAAPRDTASGAPCQGRAGRKITVHPFQDGPREAVL